MKPFRLPHSQHGATLVVGLIMLALITVMVTSAYTVSNSNLKAVGNMQTHNESIAAANKAIEQVVNSWDFASAPMADEIRVSINNDNPINYIVKIATPACVSSSTRAGSTDPGSELRTGIDALTNGTGNSGTTSYSVVWDVAATVSGVGTNTSLVVHQGINRTLSQTQCNAACPPAAGQPCV